MQQRVVERLTAIFGCLYEDAKVLHNFRLTAEVVEVERTQGILIVFLTL